MQHRALYNLVFLRVVGDLQLGPHFEEVAAKTFAKLQFLVQRTIPGSTKAQAIVAARSVHALTEGLATMELRGALGGERSAQHTWTVALNALIGGLRDPPLTDDT